MKKIMSLVLVALMILGTCTTAFAAFPDDEINYVKNAIEAAKTEIKEIIALAEGDDTEAKIEKVEEYLDKFEDALEELGVEDADILAAIDLIKTEAADIIGIVDDKDNGAAEAKIREYYANLKAEISKYVDAETVDMIDAEIEAIANIAAIKDDEAAKDKIREYVTNIKAYLLDNDIVDADVAAKIDAEIKEIAGIIEAKDDEAAKDKIDAYIAFIKEVLDITAEDEAKVAEIITKLEAFAEELEGLSEEEIKAAIDAKITELKAQAELQVAKLGHKHFAEEEAALYVALGANVAGIDPEEESAYFELVAEAYGVEYSRKKADLADADLITYQVDAADVLLGALETEVDWSKYFTAEQLAVVETVWAEAAKIVAKDWESEGAEIYADLTADLKAAVLENLPEEIDINEEAVATKIDEIIAFAAPYLEKALEYAEDKKDLVVDTVEGLDPIVIEYAEKLAFAVVSYVIDTANEIEAIKEINPEATLVVLGMYNNLKGLEVTFDGTTVDAGEYFAYAVEATNLYYAALAAINGGFAFVNIDEAQVDGAAIEVTSDITALVDDVLGIKGNIAANADGHEYIKDQIVEALTCTEAEPSYEKLNSTKHTVTILCAICEEVLNEYEEEHSFSGKTCTLCGYVKKTTNRVSTGGGSATPKIKFDDVKKGDWFHDYVMTLFEKGLMKGISETEFAPNMPLTRGMFVTILYRVEGEPKVDAEIKFTDVKASDYYAKAVNWAASNNIVLGVSETEYAPNQNVTREQMAAILARYVAYKNMKVADKEITYTDSADIADYAKEAVKIAGNLKILIGNADGTFAPAKDATRAEAAALFVRLLSALK